LDDAMNHEFCPVNISNFFAMLVLERIFKLQKQAAVAHNLVAFF
jgi:hypothetical protein